MPRPSGRRLLVGEMADAGLGSHVTYLTAQGTRPKLRGSIRRKVTTGKVTARYVKSCMQRMSQHRWLASTLTFSSSLSAGSVQCLNDMNQGTANATRLANQTAFTELEYTLQPTTVTSQGFDTVRVVVFKDNQPEGALPTVAQLLCTATPYSCFNPDLVGNQARPRFTVLANHLEVVDNYTPFTSVTSTGGGIFAGKIKLNFTSTYEGNAGTSADLQTNGLYVMVITSGASTSVTGHYCLKYIEV